MADRAAKMYAWIVTTITDFEEVEDRAARMTDAGNT